MKNLLRQIFRRRRKGRRNTRAASLRARVVETLERRFALAVDVAFQTPTNGVGEKWVTIVANYGSDVFTQVAATPTTDLFVADNAGFTSRDVVPSINSTVDNVYVYNGQTSSRIRSFADDVFRYGLPVGYPSKLNPPAAGGISFMLPSAAIDVTEPVIGVLSLGDVGGSQVTFENFDSDNDGQRDSFRVQGGGGNITVAVSTTATSATAAGQALLTIGGSVIPSDVGVIGLPTLDISYDANALQTKISNASVEVGLATSATPTFELFDPATHQFVPGVLSGEVVVDFSDIDERLGISPLLFQVQSSGLGDPWVPISFGTDADNSWGGTRVATAEIDVALQTGATGFQNETLEITGEFNTATGELAFECRVDGFLRPFPLTLERVRIGLRDLTPDDDPYLDFAKEQENPNRSGHGTYYDPLANDLNVVPGQTLSRGLIAELPNTGSVITVESPVVTAGLATGLISLSASEVKIESPVRADSMCMIPSGSNTAFGTVTESVEINASVGSPLFDIRVADNPETFDVQRSRLLVSQTGSLSNVADVLSDLPAPLPPASQIFIEVQGGDIFIEGQAVASQQTYNLNSAVGSEEKAPYRFTTESHLTGINTGLISGGTVSATLANDTYGPAFETFQTLFSEVSLRTDIDRIRVQAGSREGHSLARPFPYKISINELNDLRVDGVASSAGPIDISAGGRIDLMASIQSLEDVSLTSGDAFTVSAPISTSFGAISIVGPTVTVSNSVRIFGEFVNEQQVDISIWATDGPLALQDSVSAINKVVLRSDGPNASVSGAARIRADIVDVDSAADVSLATEANVIKVRADGAVSIDELTAAAFEIYDSPSVTLIANGLDSRYTNTADGAVSEVSPVLYANIFDAARIVLSAPNGSIDVEHSGTELVELGDGDAIRIFNSTNVGSLGVGISEGEILPAVNSMVATSLTPVLSGSASIIAGDTFSVSVGGATYEVVVDPATIEIPSQRWELDLATAIPVLGALELENATTYSVLAEVSRETSAGTVTLTDATDNELRIRLDAQPPVAMQAAGSVSIKTRSRSGMLVSDAPLSASSASEVRFSTSLPLISQQYYPSGQSQFFPSPRPGVEPTVLRVYEPMERATATDSIDTAAKRLDIFGGVNALDLRLGDHVLVKDGRLLPSGAIDRAVNGVYVIRDIKFHGNVLLEQRDLDQPDYSDRPAVSLLLYRATEYDTTAELDGTRYFKVADGVAGSNSMAGKVFVSSGFENSEVAGLGTPLRIEAVESQAGYVVANAVSTQPLEASYDDSLHRIVAAGNGSIYEDARFFDGVVLDLNRLVLVREFASGDTEGIGLYKITNIGGENQPWQMQRYEGVDHSWDGWSEPGPGKSFTGIVAISSGTLRTDRTGQMFRIRYDGINQAPLGFSELRKILPGESVQSAGEKYSGHWTDIGDEPAYRVVGEGGSNLASGSLGLMLSLAERNLGGRSGISISPGVQRITLEQQLPIISSPMQLISTNNLVIDGSRITKTRDGALVRSSIMNQLGPIFPGSSVDDVSPFVPSDAAPKRVRRLFRDNANSLALDEIHGLEISSGASQTTIKNFTVGGFRRGAAIRVAGASNVLLDEVTVGRDGDGSSLPNMVGVWVHQVAGGAGGMFTTVLDATIVDSEEEGVLLDGDVRGVRVVGTKVVSNVVGVRVDTTNDEHGKVLVGVEPVLPGWPARHIMVTPYGGIADESGYETSQVLVSKGYLPERVEPGLQLFDQETRRTWEIINVEEGPNGGEQLLLTLDTSTAGAAITSAVPFDVEFGFFARLAARAKTITIASPTGSGIPIVDSLYLGQEVRSSIPYAIPAGTRITNIEEGVDGSLVIELSNQILLTGMSGIMFGSSSRNDVAWNDDGFVLDGGDVAIVSTDIRNSSGDGIQIRRSGNYQIGGIVDAQLDSMNNAIYGNENSGVRVFGGFFDDLVDIDDKDELGDKLEWAKKIAIFGNYFGLTADGRAAPVNGADASSNIVIDVQVGVPSLHADIREKLLQSSERDGSGPGARLKAWWKPEDNPMGQRELLEFESFDINGNLHSLGELKFGLPITPLSPEDTVDPPSELAGDDDPAEDPPGWWDNWPDLM